MPKIDFGFANFLRVRQKSAAIKGRQCTRHHKFMGNATRRKLTAPEIAHLKGTVNQLVVVGGQIVAKALLVDFDRRQSGGHRPLAVFERRQ